MTPECGDRIECAHEGQVITGTCTEPDGHGPAHHDRIRGWYWDDEQRIPFVVIA